MFHQEGRSDSINSERLAHVNGIKASPALLRLEAVAVEKSGRSYDKPDLSSRRCMLRGKADGVLILDVDDRIAPFGERENVEATTAFKCIYKRAP